MHEIICRVFLYLDSAYSDVFAEMMKKSIISLCNNAATEFKSSCFLSFLENGCLA